MTNRISIFVPIFDGLLGALRIARSSVGRPGDCRGPLARAACLTAALMFRMIGLAVGRLFCIKHVDGIECKS